MVLRSPALLQVSRALTSLLFALPKAESRTVHAQDSEYATSCFSDCIFPSLVSTIAYHTVGTTTNMFQHFEAWHSFPICLTLTTMIVSSLAVQPYFLLDYKEVFQTIRNINAAAALLSWMYHSYTLPSAEEMYLLYLRSQQLLLFFVPILEMCLEPVIYSFGSWAKSLTKDAIVTGHAHGLCSFVAYLSYREDGRRAVVKACLLAPPGFSYLRKPEDDGTPVSIKAATDELALGLHLADTVGCCGIQSASMVSGQLNRDIFRYRGKIDAWINRTYPTQIGRQLWRWSQPYPTWLIMNMNYAGPSLRQVVQETSEQCPDLLANVLTDVLLGTLLVLARLEKSLELEVWPKSSLVLRERCTKSCTAPRPPLG